MNSLSFVVFGALVAVSLALPTPQLSGGAANAGASTSTFNQQPGFGGFGGFPGGKLRIN